MPLFCLGIIVGIIIGIVIESSGDDDGYSRGNRD